MDARTGFTTPNLMEAETDRALVETGSRLVVVADHTKWGVIGISSFARLDRADVLVSDVGLPDDAKDTLRGTVRDLVLVDSAVVVREIHP
jgi:DeoR/GlpR family transcriptional regulator of sugar metabolism